VKILLQRIVKAEIYPSVSNLKTYQEPFSQKNRYELDYTPLIYSMGCDKLLAVFMPIYVNVERCRYTICIHGLRSTNDRQMEIHEY
jgi:hypothetical protein